MGKVMTKRVAVVGFICFCAVAAVTMGAVGVYAAMPAFDVNKVSNMTGYDPTTFENPTGDVLKIGVVEAFSGPAAFNGQIYWMVNTWIAYDINKRGGIMVDGKKKKIAVIKGDSQAKPANCKKVTEKLLSGGQGGSALWNCRQPSDPDRSASGGEIQNSIHESHVPF